MLEKKNAYFEEIEKTAEAFEKEKAEHEARKKEILETYGRESEELKAWYEKKAEMKFPIPSGTCKAYRAWLDMIEREEDEVEVNDFVWDTEVKDFIEAFRKAGIKTFICTDHSTGLMENLHAFVKEGCRMDGLTTIERAKWYGREGETEEIQGIHFTVC